MKVPNFLKPRTVSPPLAELRTKRDDARNVLASAQTALASTRTAVAEAVQAFDDDGCSASSEKTLHAARDAERSAVERLASAERLLAVAEQAHADAERKRRELRAAEIEALLADRSRTAELDAVEVAAWLTVVEARLARLAEEQRRVSLEMERREHRIWLGDTALTLVLPPPTDPGTYMIAESLMTEARTSGPGARQAVLLALAAPLQPPVRLYTFTPPAQRVPVDDEPWGQPLLRRAE